MNPLDEFENYLKKKVVKKQSPDNLRAEDLFKETEKSYESLTEFVKKIKINENNANHIIKNSYDIIMELVRAQMLSQGYKSSGYGAHDAEVSYLRKLNFPDNEVEFVNQLRHFRNRITYYGKIFEKDYAVKVIAFLEKIMPKLRKPDNKK